MRIDVFTIFPEYLDGPLAVSLLGRARERGLLDVRVHDPRDWTTDRHRSVDDTPFGGGAGMVMTPEPLFAAVEADRARRARCSCSRRADVASTRRVARELAAGDGFSLVCGRYEGVDQRVADHLCDGELSVGDFVLAGGEAAALVVIEAVARLVPGVMGNEDSAADESFAATGCSSTRSTRGRPSSAATRCPTCCAPATTPGSRAGAGPRRCGARSSAAPTCSPGARSAARAPSEQALLDEFPD